MRRWSLVILSVFLLACPFLWGTGLQAAEKFPNKPITFIIPIEAGGGVMFRCVPWLLKSGPCWASPWWW